MLNVADCLLRFIFKKDEWLQEIANGMCCVTRRYKLRMYDGEKINIYNIKSRLLVRSMMHQNIPENAALIQVGDYLYSFGGRIRSSGASKIALVIRIQKLDHAIKLPKLIIPKVSQSMCYHNANIFSFCGVSNYISSNQCEKYSILSKKWQIIPNALEPRELACSCSINNIAYLIGGRNKISTVYSIETLNLMGCGLGWNKLKIALGPSMKSTISGNSFAVSNDCIIVHNRACCYALVVSSAEIRDARVVSWNGQASNGITFDEYITNGYKVVSKLRKGRATLYMGGLLEIKIATI